MNLGYQFNRNSSRTVPFFSQRFNVSGAAGITGNNQDPLDWGPPTLNFANGIAALGEAPYSSPHNQTQGVSLEVFKARSRHNVTYGFDFRRQQWNILSQQDPRGTFTFTGAAAGSDLAGFLFGVPDTASIAFGNADKYFRANSWDAYVSDDWRFRSGFSLTLGVRYEYNSPISRTLRTPGESRRHEPVHVSRSHRRALRRSAHQARPQQHRAPHRFRVAARSPPPP